MYVKRYRFLEDYQGGTFTNTGMDTTINVSTYNHPAVVPLLSVTGATTVLGSDLLHGTGPFPVTLSTGNQWSLVDTIMVTHNAGDSIRFITTTPQVSLFLTGVLLAGMVAAGGVGVRANAIRNGGVAQILVGDANGNNMVVRENIDLSGSAIQVTVSVGSGLHTIAITATGNYGQSVIPISNPVAVVGTSMAKALTLAASTTQLSFTSATWALTATSTTKYKLVATLPGNVVVNTATNLSVNTVYNDVNHIPGVSFSIATAAPLVVGDTVSFTTDIVMVGIQKVLVQNTATSPSGAYYSPIVDSADPTIDYAGLCSIDTQWFSMEFACNDWFAGQTNGVNGYLLPVVAFSSGNTPLPDASWQVANANIVDTPNLQTGARTGIMVAGAPSTLRGRYLQWQIVFPDGLVLLPWFRDVKLFYWVPERDPHFLRMLVPVGVEWTPGANLQAMAGVLSEIAESRHQDVLDFIASYTFGGAVDQYLEALGADCGLPDFLFSLIPTTTFRAICQAIQRANHPTGSTPQFIAAQVALVIGKTEPTVDLTFTVNGLQIVTATSNSLTTGPVTVTQDGPWIGTITIPPPAGTGVSSGYPGLPGIPLPIAQTIITTLIRILKPGGVSIFCKPWNVSV